jgi:hypothetical protein
MRWKALRARLGRIWRALPFVSRPTSSGGSGRPGAEPEDALVPTGPPKKPPLAGAAALPLPEPEERDVDAYGKPL